VRWRERITTRALMRFLNYNECADWCSSHNYQTRHKPGYIAGPCPDLESDGFHFVDFNPPADSGKKIWFSGFLYALIEPSPELFIQIGDWDVWPSSQHMPLFTRFRQACGELRPLIEVPGHLLTPAEADDAISIIGLSLLFVWNCHILSASGRDAVFVSHDEFGCFASRDVGIAESVRKRLDEVLS